MTVGGPDTIEHRLRNFLDSALGDVTDVEIRELHRTSAGLSRENWVFDLGYTKAGRHHDEALILRRDPAGSVLHTERRHEFVVLAALERAGLPAPRARWLGETNAELGRPFVIMGREAGECEYFCLTNNARPLEVRIALAHEFVDALAAIATLDWRSVGLAELFADPGPAAPTGVLDHWIATLREVQREALPELEVVSSWLAANAPQSQASVLVHGDFKPGNALVRGDHLGVVLDWETAHIGDPLEDLGWITNPVRRGEHQIPGSWERAQIVEYWSTATGFGVDEAALSWWNILANYKLAVIGLTGVAEYIDGKLDRPYSAPLSLCRVMFDLMEA